MSLRVIYEKTHKLIINSINKVLLLGYNVS